MCFPQPDNLLNKAPGRGDIVPDGRGGFVPSSNSRYDPLTGRFLDAAAIIPDTPARADTDRFAPQPPAAPLPAPAAMPADPPPAPAAMPAAPLPAPAAPLPTTLQRAESMPVDLPPPALQRAESMPVDLPLPSNAPPRRGSPPSGAALKTFHLTDQSGTAYEIEAPDEHAAVAALQGLHGGSAPSAQNPAPGAETPVESLPPGRNAFQEQIVPAAVGAMRTINEGIPFSDRIVAGAKTLPMIGNDQSYVDNLAQEQAARGQLNQAYPLAAAFGRGVGGAATTMAFPMGAAGGFLPAMAAGMRTGLGYGAAQGVSDRPDLTDIPAGIAGGVRGGLEGGTLGALLAGTGYGAGKGAGALANRFRPAPEPIGNRAAGRQLLEAYQAGRPAGASSDYGPRGMVLDSGPAMLQLAKQTAATPQGAPIQAAVATRNNNFDRDIARALPGIIGPDQSAQAASAAVRANRAAAGKPLQPIFEKAMPVTGVSDTIGLIEARLAKLPRGTPEAQALQKAYDFLAPETDVGGGRSMRIAVTDAEMLDNAKRAIDGMIKFGDPAIGLQPGALASKNSSLKMVAGSVNQMLRDQVPDYGRTMDALASLARQSEGIEYGLGAFNSGKKAIHPGGFSEKLAGLSPGETDAVRAGMNAEIYRRAGAPASGTGLDALNSILPRENQTGGRWNAAKLNRVFEPSQIDALATLQNRGNQFRRASDAIGNAAPAPAPGVNKEHLAEAAAHGLAAAWQPYFGFPAAYHAYKALRPAIQPAIANIGRARNSALADALTSTGAAKDSIANAIGELLVRRAASGRMGSAVAPVFAGAGLGAFDR